MTVVDDDQRTTADPDDHGRVIISRTVQSTTVADACTSASVGVLT